MVYKIICDNDSCKYERSNIEGVEIQDTICPSCNQYNTLIIKGSQSVEN